MMEQHCSALFGFASRHPSASSHLLHTPTIHRQFLPYNHRDVEDKIEGVE